MPYLLAIDQGTSSSRAMLFDTKGNVQAKEQIAIHTTYPQDGWVEQSPEEILQKTIICMQNALATSSLSVKEIAAVGIANQRETTIVWDRETGQSYAPAIIWQDRRGAQYCEALNKEDAAYITKKTGLPVDAYFSASKLKWLLDNTPNLRQRAQAGQVCFGTVDSYLLWHLCTPTSHQTDHTNASRTLLYDLETQQWDPTLCTLWDIPMAMLPTIQSSTAHFGLLKKHILGQSVPVHAVMGDQQSASIGQACIEPGEAKVTYGTGAFLMSHTGAQPVASKHQLLSTVAYATEDEHCFALEGSIFIAGAAVQFLTEGLGCIAEAQASEALAASVSNTAGVHVIPALTGLGAPFWKPHLRGAIFGLTRDTRKAHMTRATLLSIVFMTKALVDAAAEDMGVPLKTLKVDGGMVHNHWFLQALADYLHIPVVKPLVTETTASGAAFMAGLGVGLFTSLKEVGQFWQPIATVQPSMDSGRAQAEYDEWHQLLIRYIQMMSP